MADTLVSTGGLSFGGTPVAGAVSEHPAVAHLLVAISSLQANRPRSAVSAMELAMEAISEVDSLMCEF